MTTHLKSWRDELPIHPAAELFPLLSKDELIELGKDIQANQIVIKLLHEFLTRPEHSSGDLQAGYEDNIRGLDDGGTAAPTTVEALMYSLRERRTVAFKEPDTRRRLAELNDEQVVEVASRLQRLKPHIAQPWSDKEITQLLIARKKNA